jgi:DNA-binding response OmpR family regulator
MSELKSNILLVEDDKNLAFVTKDALEIAGFGVIHAMDGVEGKECFENHRFDLCLIDIMLPKQDGISLTKHIRNSDPHIPILLITSKSMLEDCLQGFEAGADDYIKKPFSVKELILRMEVFLRRARLSSRSLKPKELIGSYEFCFRELYLDYNGDKTMLTQREADLLQFLVRHMNTMVRRETILEEVWGENDYFAGRSMDVFISKLRKYLNRDPKVKISNHHGIGFRLSVDH